MSGYGSLKQRPASAMPASAMPSASERATTAIKESPLMQVDPRHSESSPMPWLRYWFPHDFNQREGTEDACFYQHFDVGPSDGPYEEDVTVPPPKWTPNAYFRLSFAQKDVVGKLSEDVKGRVPTPAGQSPFDSTDFTKDNWPIYAEGAEDHMRGVIKFCRSVGTFRAKTWKDAFPLNDLQQGIILYLLDQIPKNQRLSVEKARRDAGKVVEEERAAKAGEIAAAVAKARAGWEAELQRLLDVKEAAARKEASDAMQLKINKVVEELDVFRSKCHQQEWLMKGLDETAAELQQANEKLTSEVEEIKAIRDRSTNDQSALTRAQSSLIKDLESTLERSKRCILQALEAAGDKDKIISVVTHAASLSVPGAHAYLAELKRREDLSLTQDNMDPIISQALEAAAIIEGPAGVALGGMHQDEEEGEEGLANQPPGVIGSTPITDVISNIRPGFLCSPFDESLLVETGHAPLKDIEEKMELAEGKELDGAEDGRQLVLKYVVASPGHDFMVGQVLPFGKGVSWTPIMQQEEALRDTSKADEEGEAEGEEAQLTLPSFFPALDDHLKTNTTRLASVFTQMDTDGKGGLRQDELMALVLLVMPSSSQACRHDLARRLNPKGLPFVTPSNLLELLKASQLDEGTDVVESIASLPVDGQGLDSTLEREGIPQGLPPHLLLRDISKESGVHFFRGSSLSPASSHGSLLAVPLIGLRGHVVGLLAVDTMAAASSAAALRAVAAHGGHGHSFASGQMTAEAARWVVMLAGVASGAIQRDQGLIEDAILKARLMSKPTLEGRGILGSSIEYDPMDYYLDSDKAKFQLASDSLSQLSEEDLQGLQSIEPGSLAIVRSLLSVAGEDSDGRWDELKARINRPLLDRLKELDDPASILTWAQVCKHFKSLFDSEAERGSKTDFQVPNQEGASFAIGKWVVAVRSLVAKRAVFDALTANMAAANKSLIAAFDGEWGTSALSELRSYRVCPKISNVVLSVLLLLAGHLEDIQSWGRMKSLVTQKMVKSLADIRPQDTSRKVLRKCVKVVRSVDEQTVKNESLATFTLYKWLANFAQLARLSLIP